MNALVFEGVNQPLVYKRVKKPMASANEECVEIKAAALNHRDLWITKGQYAGIKFPTILGSDGAGLLDGKEVVICPSLGWGDNPLAQSKDYQILGLPDDGTLAAFVVVPQENVFLKPIHLSWEQAAAMPLAGLTAFRAIFTKGQITKTDNVLITGIGGGAALFAAQFAIAAGANVYVTSSSDEKIAKALELGAKGGVNYKNKDWIKELQIMSGGIDLTIDSAGGAGFMDIINKIMRPAGRMVFFGGTAGNVPEFNPRPVFWKQLTLMGTSMGSPTEFGMMIDFVEKHKIVPIVDRVFDLKDGNAAFQRMEDAAQFGKIVLKIL